MTGICQSVLEESPSVWVGRSGNKSVPFPCQKTLGDVTQMYQLSRGLPSSQTFVSSSPFHLILLTCTQIKHRAYGGDMLWVGFWEENKTAVNHC